jgi:hypothetical protein
MVGEKICLTVREPLLRMAALQLRADAIGQEHDRWYHPAAASSVGAAAPFA